ncbi:MAG TPA: RDD family protein [Campylobacterales bacterium]|nr:RDD family protein [Campylobacterales bacterium]
MNEEQILDKLSMEGLNLSSISKRSFAYMIDEVIISIFIFVIFYEQMSNVVDENDIVNLTNRLFGYVIALKVIYHTFFIWQYGSTMGKMILKIKVVDIYTLDNLSFYRSFSRAMMRVISEGVFYLGYLWAVLTKTRQSWHDKFATSLVIDV